MPLDATQDGWTPQPGPQTALVRCPIFEVFFGGARGGGKTDAVLGDWISHADLYGEHAIALMVRRTHVELVETIERSKQLFTPLGAQYHEQKSMWTMPGGGRLRFAYLERDADANNYQGHSYTRVYVEEAGNFPSGVPILKLMATLRSGAGVPCGMRLTGNPGGPGHGWVKARYIDPAPLGWQIVTSTFTNPFTGAEVSRDRVFIPSKLSDNQYLGGEYVANLHMAGSVELVRAWLEGDWNVVAGAYFSEFGPQHIVRAHHIAPHLTRFRAMDWGSARPFSVGWYVINDGSMRAYPRDALIKYREWYGMKPGEPNVGLKLTAEQVGRGIVERNGADEITYSVADPAIFSEDGGPSIAERMRRAETGAVSFRPADNARVKRGKAPGGWDMLRHRLVGDEGRPMIYFFDTCADTIRTLPVLQHDPLHPEDLDTDGEDHAADETRYACMSRPWSRVEEPAPPPRFPHPMADEHGRMRGGETFNEIRERLNRRMRADDG